MALPTQCRRTPRQVSRSSLSNRGFTLVELLIAIAIFAMVMTAVSAVFIGGLRMRAEGAQNMALEREGGVILERIMRGVYGKGGLREGNSDTAVVGADGSSIWFEVDRNSTPTKTRTDDVSSLIYLYDGEVYFKPDTTIADVQRLSSGQGHIESLRFARTDARVDITIKLVADLPGTDRQAFIHLTKSVALRN
ncbi:MAG: prepilin-type N-terminal cleavage/methylation domain-containing protein [Verrucomicrobia bacterium]|nr:prepilin-type N-terminal cleavage/methylation domain-containing protein [Verrucomicrobiota bacterium]